MMCWMSRQVREGLASRVRATMAAAIGALQHKIEDFINPFACTLRQAHTLCAALLRPKKLLKNTA